jgi:hypothetical protein
MGSTMTRRLSLLLVPVVAASQLGADGCPGQLIDDRGFDLWCGDQLCAWDVDRGEVARVPTWHRGDDGVALLGPDTQLSQVSAPGLTAWCIRFTTIAHVEETAQVTLSLDLDDDGTVDHAERIPTSDWARVTFLLHVEPSSGIRFLLTRAGSGEAVLANVGAELASGCTGTPIGPRATVDGAGDSP